MRSGNTPLNEIAHTGFAEPLNKQHYTIITHKHRTPTMMKVALMGILIGTGAIQTNQYVLPGLDVVVLSAEQLQQRDVQGDPEEILSINTQLKRIKHYFGLNILELATILQVSRPTIYKWMETGEMNIRQANLVRLKQLYEIGTIWKAKQLGRLGRYLHTPLKQTSTSLFSLLKCDHLDLSKIKRHLNDVAQLMIAKRQDSKAHEALLQKHGFKPLSKEDMEDSLGENDMMDL